MKTIKEVAARARVSVATVSRVMNHAPSVAEETRTHVLQVMQEMDYHPNLIGRQLRKSQTKRVLVLIPSISNQFYSKIIAKIETTARKYEYRVLVCMTHSEREMELEYIAMIKAKEVDGLIFLTSKLEAAEMDRIARKHPVVQCCEFIEGSHTDVVSIDNEKAAYDAVSFLLDQGHRAIAFFGSAEKYHSGNLREKGYRRALQERGIPLDKTHLFFDGYSYQSGERMAERMIACANRPSAVFCISDSIAIGCMKKLIDKGIRVPDDISVMGFDDTSIAKMVHPELSTVAQPQADIGESAMEMLMRQINGGEGAFEFKILPHRLALRDTVSKRKT